MATNTHSIDSRRRVVIVGGGFAGLNCAKRLVSDARFRIVLIDKNNYQQFQPLLYQVASGLLSPENAAFNLRGVFAHHENITVKMSEIVSIDLAERKVVGKDGDVYCGDYLVLAAGAVANFFAIPGVEQNSFPMYSLQDAERLRSRILEVLETTDRSGTVTAPTDVKFVVVGAGPTGVETAGAIADLLLAITKSDSANPQSRTSCVTLVDAGERILSPFTAKSQEYAAKKLKERGVDLRLGMPVKEVGKGYALLSDGSRLAADLVVWAGGLKASPLSGAVGVKPGRGARIDVQPNLTIGGHDRVYALGDFANLNDKDGRPLPQLASVAQQAGRHCAANIIADASKNPQTPFIYYDKGILAMVGRNAAVAELGASHCPVTGFLAFAAWLGVHAVLLTTMRARFGAALEWMWDYFGTVRVGSLLDRPTLHASPEKPTPTEAAAG